MILGFNMSVRRNLHNMERNMGPARIPVNGNTYPGNEIVAPNPFARLVQILKMNERLLGELQRLNGQLEEARDYLVRPGCNVVLGMATLDRAKRRRSAVLCRLRAHRIEADRILGGREWRDATVAASAQASGSPRRERPRNDS